MVRFIKILLILVLVIFYCCLFLFLLLFFRLLTTYFIFLYFFFSLSQMFFWQLHKLHDHLHCVAFIVSCFVFSICFLYQLWFLTYQWTKRNQSFRINLVTFSIPIDFHFSFSLYHFFVSHFSIASSLPGLQIIIRPTGEADLNMKILIRL